MQKLEQGLTWASDTAKCYHLYLAFFEGAVGEEGLGK